MPIIEEVCAASVSIPGEHVLGLEADGGPGIAVIRRHGVSSGTDALLLALRPSVRRGREIITSPFTFLRQRGTVAPGARPFFCDTTRFRQFVAGGRRGSSWSGMQAAKRRVINRARAPHQGDDAGNISMASRTIGSADGQNGQAVRLQVSRIARSSIGNRIPGRACGLDRRLSVLFQFFPSKNNLGAFGDSWIVYDQRRGLEESMRVRRVHGGKPKYFNSGSGGKLSNR